MKREENVGFARIHMLPHFVTSSVIIICPFLFKLLRIEK